MASILVEFELSEKMKKLFAFSGHHLCAVKLHHWRLNADVGSSSPHLTYQFPSVLSVYFGDFELFFLLLRNTEKV